MTLTCHPEAQPKDLANEKEILRFAQNDSFAVTLAHFRQFLISLISDIVSDFDIRISNISLMLYLTIGQCYYPPGSLGDPLIVGHHHNRLAEAVQFFKDV